MLNAFVNKFACWILDIRIAYWQKRASHLERKLRDKDLGSSDE